MCSEMGYEKAKLGNVVSEYPFEISQIYHVVNNSDSDELSADNFVLNEILNGTTSFVWLQLR